VALTDDGDVWWEGMTKEAPGPPDRLAGQGLDAGVGRQGRAPERALHRGGHPEPVIDPAWDDPAGVPISPSSSAAAAPPPCRW
jgi:phosphoenolpyruvate carboxykinase (GTP)